MKYKKFVSTHWLYLLIIIIFSFLGLKALLHPGLYTAHDIWHQVARLYHYKEAILDGQFLPGWISNLSLGYGYPMFIFSYHLPWIVALPFIFSGLSIALTIKILFFLSFFTSGLAMYGLANYFFKDKLAALLSALLYLWAPYHFLTVFVSAAMGTSFVFIFLPLIFWGVSLSFEKNKLKAVSLLTIGLTGSILSHLMTTVMVAPFIVLFTLYLFIDKHKGNSNKKILNKQTKLALKNIALGILFTLLITSFYLLPLIAYMKKIIASNGGAGLGKVYLGSFVNFKQLLYSKWGVVGENRY